MDIKPFRAATLFILDVDNVLYPYDNAFGNMIHQAVVTAVMKLRARDTQAVRLPFERAKELVAVS
ncbi:MAG: hypothetical protein ACOYNL_09955 [Rickettsiales bacterium]